MRATTNIATCTYTLARMRIATGRATPRHSLITWTAAGIARAHGLPDRAVAQHAWAGHRTDTVPRWGHRPRKNSGSHIDASLSRQPLVKGERLVRYEVNAVMPRRRRHPCAICAVSSHAPFHCSLRARLHLQLQLLLLCCYTMDDTCERKWRMAGRAVRMISSGAR